jgi:hypothetical protein
VLAVKSLNDASSDGFDRVSVRLIKSCLPDLAPILLMAFNNCMEAAVFPDCLKISRIVPIFKSRDRLCASNYCSIAVIPNFAKIFERLMHSRLVNFYESIRFFHPCQYGFVSKTSTASAVLDLVTFLRGSLTNRLYIFCHFHRYVQGF